MNLGWFMDIMDDMWICVFLVSERRSWGQAEDIITIFFI